MPDSALKVSKDGTRAKLKVRNLRVEDSFQFFGPRSIPAKVSFTIRWKRTGGLRHYEPRGTGRTAFRGDMYDAVATGTFKGSEEGFKFTTISATTTNPGGWAEMGTEQNGRFL